MNSKNIKINSIIVLGSAHLERHEMKPGYKHFAVTKSLTSREGDRESGGSGRVPIAKNRHFSPKNGPPCPPTPSRGGGGEGGTPEGGVGVWGPPLPPGGPPGSIFEEN